MATSMIRAMRFRRLSFSLNIFHGSIFDFGLDLRTFSKNIQLHTRTTSRLVSCTRSLSTTTADATDATESIPNHLNPNTLDLLPELRNSIVNRFGITKLFPIQAECYPILINGHDLMGRSRTGTGKTLAFVLPIVQRLMTNRVKLGRGQCQVVIMEPTRELAKQVALEIEKLSKAISVLTIYGGASYFDQEMKLRHGVDIVVATPGRLIDHIQRKSVDLSAVRIVVLDESDEMLKMGFQDDVESIFREITTEHQTLLFSATMPSWVKTVAQKYLKSPKVVDKITGDEHANKASLTVTHKAIACLPFPDQQVSLLTALVKNFSSHRAMIFVKRKADADSLVHAANGFNLDAAALHGDVQQSQRERILDQFRKGQLRMLVCTDVAARGIDVPAVELVVQVGLPDEPEAYIHRSGRTGRAGRLGTSIIMYAPRDRPKLKEFSKLIGVTISPLYPPSGLSQIDEEAKKNLVSKVENIMSKEKGGIMQFSALAEKLTELHGSKPLAALLAAKFGSDYAPRSLLTGEEHFTTTQIKASSHFEAERRVRSVIGGRPINRGQHEVTREHVFLDLMSADAASLQEAIANDPQNHTDINFPVELPLDLFDPHRLKISSGKGRGGNSAATQISSGRGRGNKSTARYGGAHSSGYDERRVNRDRVYGLEHGRAEHHRGLRPSAQKPKSPQYASRARY